MNEFRQESAVPFKEVKRYGSMYGNAGVILREAIGKSVVQISAFPGSEKAMFAALERDLSIVVDGTSGKCGVNDNGSILAIWSSLNSYLIVGAGEGDGEGEGFEDRALANRLQAALSEHALVTDQSAGRTCIEVKGKSAVELLMSEAATDLSPEAFSIGQSRAISWAGISAIVHYKEDMDAQKPVLALYVLRSFAQSLWEELCEVGQEHAVQVVG